jgi:hypothetical protein
MGCLVERRDPALFLPHALIIQLQRTSCQMARARDAGRNADPNDADKCGGGSWFDPQVELSSADL